MQLVDRDAALATLLAAVPETRGHVILITGESGTGKSSLMRATRDVLRTTFGPSLRLELIDCLPSATPYACWAPVLEHYPTIRSAVPAPLGAKSPAAQGPEELAYRTARTLHEHAETDPLVLMYDDIHSADESSLKLMLAAARQVERSRLNLILSCELPLPEGAPIARFVPELFQHTPAQSIDLGPLSTAGIQQLIERRLTAADASVAADLAGRVQDLSGGNALYVTEMLDALIDAEALDGARAVGEFSALPFSLRQLAENRLAHVSRAARETLELAAIIGEAIDLELLEAITGHGVEELIEQLEQALAHSVLIEDERGQLRFRHGVVRRMLAERQSGLRRQRWHAAILAVLEARGNASLIDIARHAEAAGVSLTAAEAYRRAGHQARDLFNMPEAGRYYRRALEIAEQAGHDDALCDDLRLQYADSIVRNDPAVAEREFERVAARAFVRGGRATLAKARTRQAMLFYETGRHHDAVAILDELVPELEALEDWKSLADAVTCALYCALAASDFLEIDRLSAALVELADRIADPSYRANAYFMDAMARVARGEASGAPRAIRDAIAMAVELGQLDIATPWTAVAFFRVDIFANLHHPEQVAELIQRGLELDAESNRRIGLSPDACECTPEFALWWFWRGEWDAARDILIDPISIRADRQPQVLKDSVQVIAAEMALAAGELDDTNTFLEYIAPAPGSGPGDHGYQQWLMAAELRVRLALADNAPDEAERWIEALDRELEHKPHVPGELMLDLSRARVALAYEAAGAAEEIATSVVARARQTNNMLALTDGLQLLARACRQLADEERALTTIGEAIAVAGQCQLGFLQALAQVTRYELVSAFGDKPNSTPAGLEALREELHELGASAAVERLNELQKKGGERPGGLTKRELDVLTWIVEGKTDNEIAELLFISPRTVSTHVGNMLAKTDTINRVELASWAHQNNALR